MTPDPLGLAAELRARGEAFALATVVRCERPTSAKPGAKAVIRGDGTLTGWVGGACAEPVVVREALRALRDGQPRLVGLAGEGSEGRAGVEGILSYPMTCHSGGTLEIYVEPYLPRPALVLVGHGPVVAALAALGRATEWDVTVLDGPDAPAALARLAPGLGAAVVVATHGDGDEDALAAALPLGPGYVSLVASRKRAAVVVDSLRARGLAAELLGRLKAPAGLDLGAVTPEEIAVSILAEIVQARRSAPAPAAGPGPTAGPAFALAATARDPVCGMTVTVATARHRSDVTGQPVYFCCRHCQEAFEREPARYHADRRP